MKRRGNVDICPLASRSNHVALLSQLALLHADALNKGLLKFWPRADYSAPRTTLSICAKGRSNWVPSFQWHQDQKKPYC